MSIISLAAPFHEAFYDPMVPMACRELQVQGVNLGDAIVRGAQALSQGRPGRPPRIVNGGYISHLLWAYTWQPILMNKGHREMILPLVEVAYRETPLLILRCALAITDEERIFAQVQKCPVCRGQGWGIISTGNGEHGSMEQEMCDPCDGRGWVPCG